MLLYIMNQCTTQVSKTSKCYLIKTTCWRFGGDEVPGGYDGLSERLNFEVKIERWDLVPGKKLNLMMAEKSL